MHIPVLLQESVDALNVSGDAVVVDATLGEGGHAREILRRLSDRGKLIGIERDSRMLAALALSDQRMTAVEGNFKETSGILKSLGHDRVHAVHADLGISTRHYRTLEWGFSFEDGPLDMRLGKEGPTAADVVNEWNEDRLAKWLLGAGVRQGRKIAKAVAEARGRKKFSRTSELASLVQTIAGGGRRDGRGRKSHPATKTFRAIREAVTGELEDLRAFVKDVPNVLAPAGRLAILTYTWEEEGIVRSEANVWVKGCICPPRLAVCRCGRKPGLRWISKKGVWPAEEEIRQNPAARSARLFVMERI